MTIPKEARQRVKIKAGETVVVEAQGEDGVIIKRLPKDEDPLKVLIGKRPLFDRHIPIDELEEKMEEMGVSEILSADAGFDSDRSITRRDPLVAFRKQ